MTDTTDQTGANAPSESRKRIVISVDAMGGDLGPAAVVAGISRSAQKNPDIGFIVHGDEKTLKKLIKKKKGLKKICEIRHCEDVVTMHDKPSHVMRHGKKTSMWSAIESVKQGEASVAVSCGNTGALMAVSMVRLRKLPGVVRPAIACLWPSRNPGGFNVMLDVGADIRADENDLLQYARMGASYARNGLGLTTPRVGLLNVGTEEHKGRPELHAASDLIQEASQESKFDYVGFVEGGDIPGDSCDVIVTDGYTGNIALKTGEGTAKLIGDFLRESFKHSFLSKIAAMLSMNVLKRLQKRIDPRRVNGGVFLGLNGTVIKSHGSSDATGVSAAIKLAFTLADNGFNDKLRARVAAGSKKDQDTPTEQ